MQTATLCILWKDEQICLGIKKRLLGKGKYNGFGGRVEAGETVEQAALRELSEETKGVKAIDYRKVGEMTYIFPKSPEWDQIVHIYLVTKWAGEPMETDEMTVEWFPRDKIPYDKMWDNDRHWLPLVLDGKKIRGKVVHSEQKTIEKNIDLVDGNL
jgi:ADP-ribose pyrophosphatase YjhB (NUDIX family)